MSTKDLLRFLSKPAKLVYPHSIFCSSLVGIWVLYQLPPTDYTWEFWKCPEVAVNHCFYIAAYSRPFAFYTMLTIILTGLDSTSHAPHHNPNQTPQSADNPRLLDPISTHGIGIYRARTTTRVIIPSQKDFFIPLCTRSP